MLGPRITPAGSPPTRSAKARRAASTSASARAEDGNGPRRLDSGTRSAADDRAGHALRDQRPGRPVEVDVAVAQRREESADAGHVEGHAPTLRGSADHVGGPLAVTRSASGMTRRPVTDRASGRTGARVRRVRKDGRHERVAAAPRRGRRAPTASRWARWRCRPRRADDEGDEGGDPTGQIAQPAKVMRIGTMIKQLLEEVRAAPLDEASRARLREIHQTSIKELEEGLSPELREELDRLTLPFEDSSTPSDAELRIAQAQLVGWLEGLFHGIQTALFAQQMAAQAQLRGDAPAGAARRSRPAAAGDARPDQPAAAAASRAARAVSLAASRSRQGLARRGVAAVERGHPLRRRAVRGDLVVVVQPGAGRRLQLADQAHLLGVRGPKPAGSSSPRRRRPVRPDAGQAVRLLLDRPAGRVAGAVQPAAAGPRTGPGARPRARRPRPARTAAGRRTRPGCARTEAAGDVGLAVGRAVERRAERQERLGRRGSPWLAAGRR